MCFHQSDGIVKIEAVNVFFRQQCSQQIVLGAVEAGVDAPSDLPTAPPPQPVAKNTSLPEAFPISPLPQRCRLFCSSEMSKHVDGHFGCASPSLTLWASDCQMSSNLTSSGYFPGSG